MTQQTLTFEEAHIKKPSQKERVLEQLRQGGMWGVSNIALNKTCFRYAARIKNLRDDGHIIQTVKERNGVFRFVLVKEAKDV